MLWRKLVWSQPSPGLANCLAASLDSSGGVRAVSVLGDNAAMIIKLDSTQLGEDALILCSRGSLAHAVSPPGFVVHVSANALAIYSEKNDHYENFLSVSVSPFPPRDVACAILRDLGLTVVMATAKGIIVVCCREADPFHVNIRPSPLDHLPGSEVHTCVSVAISTQGYIAGATIDGRLIIWVCDHSRAIPQCFSTVAVFSPCEQNSMQDRITHLEFSPFTNNSGKVDDSQTLALAVAWWSGRVDMYFRGESGWSSVWTHSSKPLPSKFKNDIQGINPGTYVAFAPNSSVVSVATGQGRITFLTFPDGFEIATRAGILHSEDNIPCQIKGIAADIAGVLLLSRKYGGLYRIAWPQNDVIAQAISHGMERQKQLAIMSVPTEQKFQTLQGL